MQYALRAFNEQFHNLIKATQSIADEQEEWIDWIWKRELQGCKTFWEFLSTFDSTLGTHT